MDNRNENIILFEPDCKIGETVYHKHDKMNDNPLIVTNYNINAVNKRNEVVDYTIGCSNQDGRVTYMKPFELKVKDKVNT